MSNPIVLYASVGALETKMIGTTFDTATTDLANACLLDATQEIVKKLSKRYDFSTGTFDTVTSRPILINSLCETLAIGYMYEHLSRGSKEGFARAKRFIDRAMENLEEIRIGDVALINPSTEQQLDQLTTDWAVNSSSTEYANTFNEDDPKKWKVDPNKLDDIKDERETDTGDSD